MSSGEIPRRWLADDVSASAASSTPAITNGKVSEAGSTTSAPVAGSPCFFRRPRESASDTSGEAATGGAASSSVPASTWISGWFFGFLCDSGCGPASEEAGCAVAIGHYRPNPKPAAHSGAPDSARLQREGASRTLPSDLCIQVGQGFSLGISSCHRIGLRPLGYPVRGSIE
jgi:hypothetical protein